MTSKEEYIYNCYLEVSRKINNKPFNYRKNFDDFESKEEYPLIVKLGTFFNRFEQINIKDFFTAPYFVHNEKFFDLKYFTTQKAIKSYTIYQNTFLPQNPDHEKSIEKIKDSFEFVYNFCKSKQIDLDQYTSYIQDNKWHEFLTHLKHRNITIYSIFCFPNFEKIINLYDKEIKDFAFGDTFKNIGFYRSTYHGSSKAKKLCTVFYDSLNNRLKTIQNKL